MAKTSKNSNNTDMFETPGQVLRLYREKMELSVEGIAKRVHLDVKIIESIENDSQEGLPAAIYVRGYLRSYAKIVGANADEIIKLYDEDSPPPPPEILPEVKPPTQVSSNDKPVKAFTYFISLGLVLLLLIWYQSNFVVDSQTSNQQINSDSSINGVDITYDVIHHSDSWKSQSSDLEDYIETSIEPDIQLDLDESTISNTEQTIETTILQLTPAETPNESPSLSVTGQGPDTIEMKLSSDSWIEIDDANNNRLFHDLAIAGKQYSIKGTAPLSVLLGYSVGITIIFNGKPFDVEPYSKSGVARFTLPE